MGVMENMQHLERYGGVSRGQVEEHLSENGECSFRSVTPKFKRRKVSAVRDFPEGCGRNAPRIHATSTESVEFTVAIGGNCVSQAALEPASVMGRSPQLLNNLVETEVPKVSNNLEYNIKNTAVSFNVVEDLTSNNEKREGVGLCMSLGDTCLVDSLNPSIHEVSELLINSSIHEVSELLINPQKTENTDLTEENVLSNDSQAGSNKDENISKKTRFWNYPPPRKVFAIRDFPALCGRNAQTLGSEETMKVLAIAKSTGSGQKRSVAEEIIVNYSVNNDLEEKNMEAKTGKELVVYGGEAEELDENVSKEGNQIVLHKNKSVPKMHLDSNDIETHVHDEDVCLDLVVVEDSMAAPNYPQKRREDDFNPGRAGKQASLGKNHVLLENGKSISWKKKSRPENLRPQSLKGKISLNKKSVHNESGKLARVVESSEDDEEIKDFHVARRPQEFNISLPPFGQSSSSGKSNARSKVRESLRIFQAVCRKILQEEEAKPKQDALNEFRSKRIDIQAAKIIKNKGKYVNTGKQILGPVPGVEVGDEFQYRIELAIVGLHRPPQAGIDFLRQGKNVIATSVVASGGYDNDLDDADVLIYMGAGGNIKGGDKPPEDQKLVRGNLALKNSAHEKSPVRVIRGFKERKASDSSDGKSKVVCTLTYDGLYLVEKYWQEPMGPYGKMVFQFKLVRIPGQPELAWNKLKTSQNLKIREGICIKDISQGKELIPICAINTIDDEKPPKFQYISNMIYPNWCNPIVPKGCGCINGCSESVTCSCIARNGLEFPYNHNGAIVEAKPLVFECGPSCKCRPSCYNRATQLGIKFHLEIFKTVSRGWGVRSANSIPSGSFICEYLGELLDDQEAEQRTGSDEYLFDIGQNGTDKVAEDNETFTIDAAQYGNVGRFINHSCSPNLYAQNVLYDHDDTRMPHVMFFAAENIPPLQELTYHYNYTIDEVRDSNGNIKKKSCHCGSSECVGRMY